MKRELEKSVLDKILDKARDSGALDKTEVRLLQACVNITRQAIGTGPFICGMSTGHGEGELPEFVEICPMYGLSGFALYKLHTDYTEPGW